MIGAVDAAVDVAKALAFAFASAAKAFGSAESGSAILFSFNLAIILYFTLVEGVIKLAYPVKLPFLGVSAIRLVPFSFSLINCTVWVAI